MSRNQGPLHSVLLDLPSTGSRDSVSARIAPKPPYLPAPPRRSRYLDTLSDVCHSPALGRIAIAGANCVRILDSSGQDYNEIKSDAVDLDANQSVEKVGWTRDGQVRTGPGPG
jgi:hypothetical protein